MLENKNNSPYGTMSITKHRESANVSNTTQQQLEQYDMINDEMVK